MYSVDDFSIFQYYLGIDGHRKRVLHNLQEYFNRKFVQCSGGSFQNSPPGQPWKYIHFDLVNSYNFQSKISNVSTYLGR